MRLTASTQVCLDWSPGAAGLEQWRLAQLAGPYLAAAFSTSPESDSRLAIWLEVDPSRTAFDGRLLGADPVAAYADFAAGAARFTPEGEHLSTLFPPVRPRGHYLEIRYLDVQPDHLIGRVVSVLANLCTTPIAVALPWRCWQVPSDRPNSGMRRHTRRNCSLIVEASCCGLPQPVRARVRHERPVRDRPARWARSGDRQQHRLDGRVPGTR